jgi:adenine-specific DNA methylase
MWWARRPLAACRAVICAALWPDPADPLCPESFREAARQVIADWANHHLGELSGKSYERFVVFRNEPERLNNNEALRQSLLDFIADSAKWENSADEAYLESSRRLTQVAHEALGGEPGTKPLIVDPFAGGGSIPVEALRLNADAFASDINPIPVVLNKVLLEYVPKHGQQLAEAFRKWGTYLKREAEIELAAYYPNDPDGATPIAYFWARTICCEGPGCGAEVPLVRSLIVAKKPNRSVGLQLIPDTSAKRTIFRILVKQEKKWVDQSSGVTVESPKFEGTVRRGSATCPCCGYTTPVARVREQLKQRRGGTADARLFCVVTTRQNEQGRSYRLPTEHDVTAYKNAVVALKRQIAGTGESLSFVPNECLDVRGIRHTWAMIYGLERWRLFHPTASIDARDSFQNRTKPGAPH